MLEIADRVGFAGEPAARSRIEIVSVATAVPDGKVAQTEMLERALLVYPQYQSLAPLFANTGIASRYVCEPLDWYMAPHSWEERTASFQRHALDLLAEAATEAVFRAGLSLADIDAIVTNTVTGLAVPSLDALLMNRLDFSPAVERLPIFGIGCGGGVAGLARAARLARSFPDGHVLFLTVDLCSLCVRPNDQSLPMFVSAALFGDGCAAVVLGSRPARTAPEDGHGTIVAMGEHFWRDTGYIMGWDVKHDGFGVVLSAELPALMRANLRPAIVDFLARNGLELDDLDGFLIHPGGSKVLDVAEEVLGLDRDRLAPSRNVLRDFGNMSSATALFVLREAMKSGRRGRHLLTAFGPGFSAYFVVIDL